MWWRRRQQPGAESHASEGELRAQLVEACEKVRRQIEIQDSVRYSRGGGYGGDDLAVQMLRNQLEQLEASLADLEQPDRT